MDRHGTNEPITGENPCTGIMSNFQKYFVARLLDYLLDFVKTGNQKCA